MPPASRAKKRNREPPDASQDVADASIIRARRAMKRPPAPAATAAADIESEDASRSRKRSRPNETKETEQTAPNGGVGDVTSEPRRRGRPARTVPVVEEEVATGVAAAPKRRGRPSAKPPAAARPEPSPEPVPPPEHANKTDDEPRVGKRRGRKRASAEAAEDMEKPQAGGKAEAPSRRPKRSSQPSASRSEDPAESSSARAVIAPKRKRGRPSLANISIQEAQNQRASSPELQPGPKRKRGRPSLVGQQTSASPKLPRAKRPSATGAGEEAPSDAQPKRKRRPRPEPEAPVSQEQEDQETADADFEQEPAARPRKKRSSTHVEDVADSDTGGHPGPTFDSKYQYIRERMQLVPRSKIAAKWAPLDASSIDAVRAILLDAQRPVLYHLRDTQRRQDAASSILSAVCGRIQRKLGRGLPFPPPTLAVGGAGRGASSSGQLRSGHEVELDYERAVDATQAIEDQLNPSLHAVELLKAEVEKEERLLEKEYRNLRRLETNARDEAREWKKNLRTSHILAPDVGGGDPFASGLCNDDHGLNLAERQADSLYKDLEDEELLRLSQQMNSHMESMRGNLQQLGSLLPAMTKSKAALHEVLLRHLDPAQCDAVLTG